MQLKLTVVEDTSVSSDKAALSKSCYLGGLKLAQAKFNVNIFFSGRLSLLESLF
jgi:hypothetical protein